MLAPKRKSFQQHLYTCQLKITLSGSKPSIWRRLQVPDNIKLNRLHEVFQVVMGWTDSHLHQFHGEDGVYTVPDEDSDPEDYDERKYTLHDIALCEKDEFVYEYDFGDCWEHEVVVEAHLPPMEKRHAVCMDGKNACPPEDCGGIPGYYEFLKAICNPKHEDHQQMIRWIGGSFDPKHFDIQKVNARLKRMKI
jgi:hypothetical protein